MRKNHLPDFRFASEPLAEVRKPKLLAVVLSKREDCTTSTISPACI
jgi:hypothetical protein